MNPSVKVSGKRKGSSQVRLSPHKKVSSIPTKIKDTDGKSVDLDDIFPRPERHKCGLEKKSTRNIYGKVVSKEKEGRGVGCRKKGPSVVTEEMFTRTMNESWRHKEFSGQNKHNQSLKLDNGFVYCSACSKRVDFYGIPQHICGKKTCSKIGTMER